MNDWTHMGFLTGEDGQTTSMGWFGPLWRAFHKITISDSRTLCCYIRDLRTVLLSIIDRFLELIGVRDRD